VISSTRPSVFHPINWWRRDKTSITNGTHVIVGRRDEPSDSYRYFAVRLEKPGLHEGKEIGDFELSKDARNACERDYYTIKWPIIDGTPDYVRERCRAERERRESRLLRIYGTTRSQRMAK
jgi:hypothetical protein